MQFMSDNRSLPKATNNDINYKIGDFNIKTARPNETLSQAKDSLQSFAKISEGALKDDNSNDTE